MLYKQILDRVRRPVGVEFADSREIPIDRTSLAMPNTRVDNVESRGESNDCELGIRDRLAVAAQTFSLPKDTRQNQTLNPVLVTQTRNEKPESFYREAFTKMIVRWLWMEMGKRVTVEECVRHVPRFQKLDGREGHGCFSNTDRTGHEKDRQ